MDRTMDWDDEAVVVDALGGREVLVFGTTGDVALALAIAGGAVEWVVPDPSLRALAELKIASLSLAPPEARALLGVGPLGRRVHAYHRVRGELGSESRVFWDAREQVIRLGVLGSGHLEQRFAAMRRAERVLHPRGPKRWMGTGSRSERIRLWKWWAHPAWRMAVARYAPCSAARIGESLLSADIVSNPYASWMLFGDFVSEAARPAYLRDGRVLRGSIRLRAKPERERREVLWLGAGLQRDAIPGVRRVLDHRGAVLAAVPGLERLERSERRSPMDPGLVRLGT